MKKISILLVTLLGIVSCKNEPKIEYKHAEKASILECSSADMDLVNEAIYSFDDYALKAYTNTDNSIRDAYFNYFGIAFRNRYANVENVDEHLQSVMNALKENEDLWMFKKGERHLNPNGVLPCIADNLKNKDLGTILNGLISTNSYDKYLFIDALISHTEEIHQDKVLATYFILETFYAKLMPLDFEDPNLPNIVYKMNDSIFRSQNKLGIDTETLVPIEVPKKEN